MKRQLFIPAMALLLLVGSVCLIACGSSAPQGERGDRQAMVLPPLAPSDTILLENELYRIVESIPISTDSTDYNQLHVHQKTSEGSNFTLRGTYLSFEELVGNSLVLSEGTGGIRDLRVYDVRTGELQLALDFPMADIPLVVERKGYFSYYRYEEEGASVAWSKQTGRWDEYGTILPEMRGAGLEEAKANMAECLFDGLTLMAYQRVRVNIETQSVELQNEYRWGYAE